MANNTITDLQSTKPRFFLRAPTTWLNIINNKQPCSSIPNTVLTNELCIKFTIAACNHRVEPVPYHLTPKSKSIKNCIHVNAILHLFQQHSLNVSELTRLILEHHNHSHLEPHHNRKKVHISAIQFQSIKDFLAYLAIIRKDVHADYQDEFIEFWIQRYVIPLHTQLNSYLDLD
jgi:hypothetical protein